MPLYATFFVIAVLSSVGLPGLNGFVGEFLILAGSFKTHPRAAVFAASGVILAAIYLLWLVQRVFFGPITDDHNKDIPEIAWNEVAAMIPLVVMMVWIGVYPNFFLRKMTPSVQRLITIVQQGGERGNAVLASSERRAASGVQRAALSTPHPLPATRRPGGGE
jgi:NADH-quinone oxidoreductase subunit M